jgi:hypothetical protein
MLSQVRVSRDMKKYFTVASAIEKLGNTCLGRCRYTNWFTVLEFSYIDVSVRITNPTKRSGMYVYHLDQYCRCPSSYVHYAIVFQNLVLFAFSGGKGKKNPNMVGGGVRLKQLLYVSVRKLTAYHWYTRSEAQTFATNLGVISKFWATEGWHEASFILRTRKY